MTDRDDVLALEDRLARAWREDGRPEVGAPWKQRVMDSVRAAAESSSARAHLAIERIVRRAVLIAAAVAAVALVAVTGSADGLDPSLELARILTRNPEDLLQLVLVL